METFWLFDTYSTQVMKDCAEYLKLLKTIGVPEVCFRKKEDRCSELSGILERHTWRFCVLFLFCFLHCDESPWCLTVSFLLATPSFVGLLGSQALWLLKKKICSKWMVNQKSFWVKVNLMYWTWLKKCESVEVSHLSLLKECANTGISSDPFPVLFSTYKLTV